MCVLVDNVLKCSGGRKFRGAQTEIAEIDGLQG